MKLCRLFHLFLMVMTGLAACGTPEHALEAGDQPPEEESTASAAAVESERESGGEQTAVLSGTAGSFFAINEIGLGPEGFIALTNFIDVPVSMRGLYLCQAGDCFALPDRSVAAGETVRVAAGNGGNLENVVAREATFGELRRPDGEIAIFTSPNTSDPEAMLVYLQWGSTPHELTALAVENGLWFETAYAPSGENATRLWRIEESGLWVWE